MANTATRNAAKLPKPVKAWAGVSDGKIHFWGKTAGNYCEIYRSRSQAKAHYERVVRVKIIPQEE